MRRTKIVATIGPASREQETLVAMVQAGMDVARLNFSHGNRELHAENAERVRAAAEAAGRQVAILQDLPGPKLRIGALDGDIAELKPGDRLMLDCGSDGVGDARRMSVSWPGLAEAVSSGDVIYLADGGIRLRVRAVHQGSRRGRDAGRDRRRGLLAPGVEHPGLDARRWPAVPEEDLDMLKFGESIGVDLVALSFVRTAEDVTSVRRHTRLPLIAKIEKPQAVNAAEEIIRAADCVMVARGDLGIELPIADVPMVQKQLLRGRGAAGAALDHGHPDARLDGQLDAPDARRGRGRRQRDPRRHRRRDALAGDRHRLVPGGGGGDDGLGRGADRARAPVSGLERGPRASRRPRPRLHGRLHGVRGGARPAPRRAGRAHAVGPLRAPGLGAPPPGADLRALARAARRCAAAG